MSERIVCGCEDCYRKEEPLRTCPEHLVPKGARAELCGECIATRETDRAAGKAPRPVGIPADGPGLEWVDLGEALTYADEDNKNHTAQVRYQRPVAKEPPMKPGEVRFRLADGMRWLPAGSLNFAMLPFIVNNPGAYALNAAMSAIQMALPHARMMFVRQKKM